MEDWIKTKIDKAIKPLKSLFHMEWKCLHHLLNMHGNSIHCLPRS